MEEKQFIKKIIINTFGCSDYFFESVWKHIEESYKKSINLNVWRESLYVLYDKTRTDTQYDAVKAVSILYETIKAIEKTGKVGQFLKALEEASKRHHAEEALKLKILKNIEFVVKDVRDIIKTGGIGKPPEQGIKYEEQISLEKSTLEIDYLNEEPIVKLNGRIVEEFKTHEIFFARFVRLAVARKVNEKGREGKVYKYDLDENDKTNTKNFNLYIGGFRQKEEDVRGKQDQRKKRDRELYELRKFLEGCKTYGLSAETKKKLIWSRKQFEEVKLELVPENIKINIENFKKFKSHLKDAHPDAYGTSPSEITAQLIRDAYEGYKNPSHTSLKSSNLAHQKV